MKKIIGFACWLVAFLIPAKYGLLETETVGNIPGLIGFVAFVALIFIGYWLVDSSSTQHDHASH
jgi:hypothetical protein